MCSSIPTRAFFSVPHSHKFERAAWLLHHHQALQLEALEGLLAARSQDDAGGPYSSLAQFVERELVQGTDSANSIHGLLACVKQLTDHAASHASKGGASALEYSCALKRRLLAARCLFQLLRTTSISLRGRTTLSGSEAASALSGGELLHLVNTTRHVGDALARAPVRNGSNPSAETLFILFMCLFQVADLRAGTLARGARGLDDFVLAAPLLGAQILGTPQLTSTFTEALTKHWSHPGARGVASLAFTLLLQAPALVASTSPARSSCPVDAHMQQALDNTQAALEWSSTQQGSRQPPLAPGGGTPLARVMESTLALELLSSALSAGGVSFLAAGLASPAVQRNPLALECFVPLLHDALAELVAVDSRHRARLLLRSKAELAKQRARDPTPPPADGSRGVKAPLSAADDAVEDVAALATLLVRAEPQLAADYWCKHSSLAEHAGMEGDAAVEDRSSILDDTLPSGHGFPVMPSAAILTGAFGSPQRDAAPSFVKVLSAAAATGDSSSKAAFVRLLAALATPVTTADNVSCVQRAFSFLTPPSGASAGLGGALPSGDAEWRCDAPVSLRALLGFIAAKIQAFLHELQPADTPSAGRGGPARPVVTPAAPAGPARLSPHDVELLLAICALLTSLCSSPRVRSKLLQAFPSAPRALVTLVKQAIPIPAKGALYSALAALARDTGVNGQLWELVEQQQLLASVRREVLDAAAAPRRLLGSSRGGSAASAAWPCLWEQLPDARSPDAFLGSAPLGNDGVLLELNDREASALQYSGTDGFLGMLRCLLHGARGSHTAQTQVAQLSLGLRLPGVGPYMRFVVEHIICSALRRRYDSQRRAEPWQLLATALGIVFDELQAYQVTPPTASVDKPDTESLDSIATSTPRRSAKRAAAMLTPEQLKDIVPGHMAYDFVPQLSAAAAQAHRSACGERTSRTLHTGPGMDVSLTGLGPQSGKAQQESSGAGGTWAGDAGAGAAADSSSVMAPRSAGYGIMYQLLSGGKLLHALLSLLLLDGGAAALKHARHAATPGAAGSDGSHSVAEDFFGAGGEATLDAVAVKEDSEDAVREAALHGAPAEMWWRERALTLVLGILHAASCRETAFMAAVRAAERNNSAVGGVQGGKVPPAAPLRPLARTLCSFGVLPHILRYAAYNAAHEPRLALAAARVLGRFTAEAGVELADAALLNEQLRLAPELWGAEVHSGDMLVGHSTVGSVGSALGLPTTEHGTVHLCLRWGAADEFAGAASASTGWTPLLQVGSELSSKTEQGSGAARGSRKRSRSGTMDALLGFAPELRRGGQQGDQLRSLTRALAAALADDGGSAAEDARRQLLAVRLLVGQAVGGSSHTDVELAAGDDASLDALLLGLLVGPEDEEGVTPDASLHSTWGSSAVPGDSFKLMVQAHEADPAAGGWSGPCSTLPTDPSVDLGSGLNMHAVGARALLLQGCGFSTEVQVLSRLVAKQALTRQLLEWLRRLVCAGSPGAASAGAPLQALSSTSGGGRVSVLPENMALELLGMGPLLRAAKGNTPSMHSRSALSPVQAAHTNRLLRSLLRTAATRGLAQRRPMLAVAVADLLGCLMNSSLVAPVLGSLMDDFQTREGQIAHPQLRQRQHTQLGVDLLEGVCDPRPFWSALAWESGVAHKGALHMGAAAAHDDALAAAERSVTEDACLLAGKGALLLGVAHSAAKGDASAQPLAKGLGLSPRDAAQLANVAMDVSEQCSTLAADSVVARRLLAALLLRGQAQEIMMLARRPEASAHDKEQLAPHSLAYALAGLFSPVHVGGQRTTGALQWWGALPLAEPLQGAAPEGSMAAFISDAVALYKQRLEGVNADVGEGVLEDGAPAPGSFLAVGSHSVRVLHPQMFRAVLLHGLTGRALSVPSDLLSGGAGGAMGSTARTSIGGGLSSVVGTGWSAHSSLLRGGGRGAGDSSGTITRGLFAANSAPSSAAVQADAVGAMVALGSAWARTHALRTRAVSASVQLLEAWQGAVTVGMSLGGGALGSVLVAGTHLRGMEGLTPARTAGRGGVGASSADVLAAPVVEPNASSEDAVASTCHALLRAVLKSWAGSDSSCLPLPVADSAAGICMGLLWVLRGAGALPAGSAAQAQSAMAAVDTASGTGSSPGSLRLSADRSQGLMRDLVTLLCAPGTGVARDVLPEALPLMGGAPSAVARQRLYCAASQLMQHAAGQSLSPVTRRTLALTAVLSVGGGLSEAALLAAAGLGTTGQRMKPSAALAVSRGGVVPHDRNDCDLASALLSVLPPAAAHSGMQLPVDTAVNQGAVDALGLEARGGWEAVGLLATIPGAAASEGAAVLAALGVLEVPAAPSLLDHFVHTNTSNLPGVQGDGAYSSAAAWPVPREGLSTALDLSAGGIASALVAMGTALVTHAAGDSCRGPPVLRATALQSLSEVFAFARRVRAATPDAPVVAAAAGWVASLRSTHRIAGLLDSLKASDKYESRLRQHLASESAASMQALHAQAVAASQAVRSFVGLSNLPQFTELGGGAVRNLPLWSSGNATAPSARGDAGADHAALSQLRQDMAASAKMWSREASHRTADAATSSVTPATVALVHSETLGALVQLCLSPGGADALLTHDLLGVLAGSKWTAALRDALAGAVASEAPAAHTAALLEASAPRLRSVLLVLRVLVTGKAGDAATLGGVRQWLGHHSTLLRVVLQMAAKPQPPLCALVLAHHVMSLLAACVAVPASGDEPLAIQVEIASLVDSCSLHRCAVALLARFSPQPLAAPYAIPQSGVTASAAAGAAHGGERATVDAAVSAVQLQGGIGSWEAPPVQATAVHGPCPWWLSMTPLTPSEQDLAKRRVALAPINGLVQTQYACAAVALGQRLLNGTLHYLRQRSGAGPGHREHSKALFVPAAASAADEDSTAIAQCISVCMQLGVAARNALETLIALRRIAAVGVPAARSIGDLKAHIQPSGGYGSGSALGGGLGVEESELALFSPDTAPVVVWRALTRARENARMLTESTEVALLLWYTHAAADTSGGEVRRSVAAIRPLIDAFSPISDFTQTILRHLAKLPVA